MECFAGVLENKRTTAQMYEQFFQKVGVPFVAEPADARSNYWLNAIVLKDKKEQERFLSYATEKGVQARPVWKLMSKLAMYSHCQRAPLETAEWMEERLVNIPSSVRI